MGVPLDEKTSALVLRQVEFYFSDSNLPGDKFLRQCVEEAVDGLVSLPLVCSFGRMRTHLGLKESGPDKVPAETTAAVADVLRKSTVLKLSEDGQKVGRAAPLLKLEEVQAAVDARSIAVGPLRWSVTMEEVETFISQHVQVNSVRLPRHPSGRAFCGSAVLELCSEEEAKKALELKLTYDGADLEIKTKKDLDAELERTRMQAKEVSNGQSHRKAEAEFVFPKGLIVAFSLQKASPLEEVSASEPKETTIVDSKEGEASKEESTTGASAEESSKEGIEVLREDIRNAFKGFGYIKYIDYNRGATTGYLRYEKPEEVQKARTAAVLADAGGIVVKDYIATLEAVEGAAEEEYWNNIRISQEKVRAERGGGSGGRGGRGSHGRGGGRFHDKPRRDKRSGERKGQELEDGKAAAVPASLGKHQRFEDADSEDEAEHPCKQSKSAVGDEPADLTAKQSDAGDATM